MLLGLGLWAFVGWRVLQAVFDADHEGTDLKGWTTRAGQAVSGCAGRVIRAARAGRAVHSDLKILAGREPLAGRALLASHAPLASRAPLTDRGACAARAAGTDRGACADRVARAAVLEVA